jgi:transglutaminase-like putative cysteine protease
MSAGTGATAHRRGRYDVVVPLLAGLTVVCSSTALSGVITGGDWLGTLALTVFFLAGIGLLLRMLRVPTPLVAIGQMFGLACLSTAMFARDGVLGFLPGPRALGELAAQLTRSLEIIRVGVPPVEAKPAILCLAVITIGLVAVIVDVLVTPGRAPAAAGLMLLCVYAVPASLADDLLPWWTFMSGAASFALLLAVDRAYRQQAWRGGGSLGAASRNDAIPAAAGLTGLAMVIALLAGTQISMIGTEGRIPGSDGGARSGPSQLGIKPFTTLRGMLDAQDTPTELFRVRGLGADAPYLRSLTLQDYSPGQGWRVRKTMDPGVPAGSASLPPGIGDGGRGPRTKIDIQSVNWLDVWLPVYGVPRRIQGVGKSWRYDNTTGIVYSQRARNPGGYTEQAMLAEPTPQQLSSAPPGAALAPGYTKVSGVDPRVLALTRRLTANAHDDFDRAAALYRYFTSTGGFTYSTRTAPATDSDALADFVLRGKTGFCEQYASAMAVMLRAIGVPSRVAIGFTPGIQKDGYRSITSQDAHAWVEVFFPGYGWMTFDPTPLSDGRSHIPGYLNPQGPRGAQGTNPPAAARTPSPSQGAPAPGQAQDQPQDAAGAVPPPGSGGGGPGPLAMVIAAMAVLAAVFTALAVVLRRRQAAAGRLGRLAGPLAAASWVVVALLLAGLVSWWLLALPVALLLAAAPAATRAVLRSRRLHTVDAGVEGAADAAWAELLAESADRGVDVGDRETVRGAAGRLITTHALDAEGQRALRALVKSVERSWYSVRGEPDPTLAGALREVLASLGRSAPLGWRARLLPRSVLRGRADAQVSPPTTLTADGQL